MNKLRAIIKRPDERFGPVTNISDTLENLQKTVEGPIETVKLIDGAVLITNKEKSGERNFFMGQLPFGDVIVGTVVILGTKGDEFTDCPLEFKTWKWLLEIWGNTL